MPVYDASGPQVPRPVVRRASGLRWSRQPASGVVTTGRWISRDGCCALPAAALVDLACGQGMTAPSARARFSQPGQRRALSTAGLKAPQAADNGTQRLGNLISARPAALQAFNAAPWRPLQVADDGAQRPGNAMSARPAPLASNLGAWRAQQAAVSPAQGALPASHGALAQRLRGFAALRPMRQASHPPTQQAQQASDAVAGLAQQVPCANDQVAQQASNAIAQPAQQTTCSTAAAATETDG